MLILVHEIVQVFERATNLFLDKQKAFILSGVSERALCGELMKYLTEEINQTRFSNYHVDVEYNRNIGEKKTIKNEKEIIIPITCDIIVHSRGKNAYQDNLIAIEMKKSSSNNRVGKDKDRERLIALTKEEFDNTWSFDGETFPIHVCRFLLGVYIEIDNRKSNVLLEYYIKGNLRKKYIKEF